MEHSNPARAASDGTVVNAEMPFDCRMASKSAKKNVRFLKMGPPIAPPNWLRLNGGIVGPSKKFLASRALFLRNSYAPTLKLFVAELVTALTIHLIRL